MHLVDFGVPGTNDAREFDIAVADDINDIHHPLLHHRAEGEQVAAEVDDARLEVHWHWWSFLTWVIRSGR